MEGRKPKPIASDNLHVLSELLWVSMDSLVRGITFYTTSSMTTDDIFCKMNLYKDIL